MMTEVWCSQYEKYLAVAGTAAR